jgi:hypothetical protein
MPDNHPEFVLPLSKVAHFFNPPPVDPLSSSPSEGLGVSGVEYVISQLHLNPRGRRIERLVLALPAAEAASSSSDTLTRALHRFAELRIERERRELANTYRYGTRVAGISLLILAICIAIGSLFASEYMAWMRPLFRHTLEYGFEILGWVMLWHPIDILGFNVLQIHIRIAPLKTLASIPVEIRTA